MKLAHLLLIEDDGPLAKLICDFLEQESFEVDHFFSIEESLSEAKAEPYDLVICDVMLPGQSGFDGAQMLQAQFNCPLLFLSALGEEAQQLKGYNLGASDYITKPVKPELLSAKIKANLRRLSPIVNDRFSIGDITLIRNDRLMVWSNHKHRFSTKDFNLLWVFALNVNKVLTREFLFEQTVGRKYDGLDRAIDLKVSRLRKVLNECHIAGLSLETEHGEGYRLNYKW